MLSNCMAEKNFSHAKHADEERVEGHAACLNDHAAGISVLHGGLQDCEHNLRTALGRGLDRREVRVIRGLVANQSQVEQRQALLERSACDRIVEQAKPSQFCRA